MVILIEKDEVSVNEYDDSNPAQIVARCIRCKAEICFFSDMYKETKYWYIEEYLLFGDKCVSTNNNKIICYNCQRVIGSIKEAVIKFYRKKLHLWYTQP